MGLFRRLFAKNKKNEKYQLGLHKSKETFSNLKELLNTSKTIDDSLYDSLEEIFISADIGLETVIFFIDAIKKEVSIKKIIDPLLLKEIIVDKILEIYLKGEFLKTDLEYQDKTVNVYLFVGVNGVGKTTTIGKLASIFHKNGKKVMIIAADTFRAGAVAQLKEWGKRANCFVFSKDTNTDPSSVIHDGLALAIKEQYDIVMVDTAGRLQTKVNLMAELSKMKRVIQKLLPNEPKETLLVIDATTGQNGLRQAEVFKESTDVSGIVLTKIDGCAKGGIVLAIRHVYGLPIKYVGLGEKIDDLIMFDVEEYIYSLFGDFF